LHAGPVELPCAARVVGPTIDATIGAPRALAEGEPAVKRFGILAACVALLGACGGDPACVIGTDCPIGRYCSADRRCVDVGGGEDSGVMDAGEIEDAGEEDSGPTDGGVDGGPVQVGVGTVIASSQAASYFVSASFTETGGTSPCTVSEPSEGCRLTACPPPVMVEDAGVPMDAGMPVAPNAGVITVEGGAAEMVTLTPGPDGLYPVATGTMPLWASSDAILTVTGVGADAPMFGVSLAGPDAVTLTAPAGGNVPVATDLAVTWTGSSPGDVVVAMSAVREGTFSLECRFEPSAGMGTIPASVLGAMGAGSAFLSLRSEQSRNISRNGWDITVALQAPGASAVLTLE